MLHFNILEHRCPHHGIATRQGRVQLNVAKDAIAQSAI